jgi:tetratricopeptide (TPR) repeat protein
MKPAACAVAVAILLGLVGAARADDKAIDKARAAREAYLAGSRQYDLNAFAPALESFKRAYMLYEDPALLYNIAQCYRQLHDEEQAVQFYRSYLRRLPGAPNRDEVQRRLATLEQSLAAKRLQIERERSEANELARQRAQAEAAERSAKAAQLEAEALAKRRELERQAARRVDRRPVYKRWWLWTTVGLVVAGGVAAGLTVALYPAPKFNPTLGELSGGLTLQVRF